MSKLVRVYKYNPFPNTQKNEIDYYEYRGVRFEKVQQENINLPYNKKYFYQFIASPNGIHREFDKARPCTPRIGTTLSAMTRTIDKVLENIPDSIKFIKGYEL